MMGTLLTLKGLATSWEVATFFANNSCITAKSPKTKMTAMTVPICVESCSSLNKNLTDDETHAQPMMQHLIKLIN